jgi:hypothetical protein
LRENSERRTTGMTDGSLEIPRYGISLVWIS